MATSNYGVFVANTNLIRLLTCSAVLLRSGKHTIVLLCTLYRPKRPYSSVVQIFLLSETQKIRGGNKYCKLYPLYILLVFLYMSFIYPLNILFPPTNDTIVKIFTYILQCENVSLSRNFLLTYLRKKGYFCRHLNRFDEVFRHS